MRFTPAQMDELKQLQKRHEQPNIVELLRLFAASEVYAQLVDFKPDEPDDDDYEPCGGCNDSPGGCQECAE